LATKAHDLEVTIANRCESCFGFVQSKNDKAEFKKNVKFPTRSTKEAMTISNAGLVRISGGPNPKEKRSVPLKDTIRRRPTLKELQEKRYPLPDSDLLDMLDDLLEKGVIQLPDPKRLEDVGRTIDPKYCRYHRMTSHPLEKGVTLK